MLFFSYLNDPFIYFHLVKTFIITDINIAKINMYTYHKQ